MEMKRKVLGYITRGEEPNWELLVFKHKNMPEAGYQVPGGVIEHEELIIDALYREIEEETGIPRDELVLKGKVNKTNYYPENKDTVYERTIFHLDYVGPPRTEWEHLVISDGEDDGMIYCHQFIPVDDLPKLAANQDQSILLL